ncbi:hypothetical protein LNV23_22160 [Paucibacter sp. DJ1R-11]|uniref:hypothetical protein n=1 Tax=Paucibacter sp. DJ1R-11 TaxID=2893556 RepID=UPI0021E42FF1|nr:hypothetical protein [Paucibacter sp. DJ1R-11]MCV2366153.1 hypothetical protein [Paucibacter sp. DJ1R-11]
MLLLTGWLLWQRDWPAVLLCVSAAGLLWARRDADSVAKAPLAPPPSLDAGVRRMAKAVIPAWTRQLGAIQSTTQSGAQELLASFSSLMELQDQFEKMLARQATSEELLALSQDMQGLSEQAMHGLQFGDRLAQMVDILRLDTEQFLDRMPSMAEASDSHAQDWLNALETRFTTEEQRQFHHGQPAAPKADKVDFF